MKIIQHALRSIEKILKPQIVDPGAELRPLHYVTVVSVDEGELWHNGLTGEMILTADAEADRDELIAKRFLVPTAHDDRKLCKELREILNILGQAQVRGISGYTILTTTDCNARCFYCYEAGCEKLTMTEKTAHDVAAYILANAPKPRPSDAVNYENGNSQGAVFHDNESEETLSKTSVHLSWFGGEPLYNAEVINVICADLKAADQSYRSSMISNGYLFDDAMIKKAVDDWHLQHIQITLDGTEAVYNNRKAFIYPESNAFQRVMKNIKTLSLAGIRVSVRLNMDAENADDLTALVESFTDFSDAERKNITIYSHLLFQDQLLQRSDKTALQKLSARHQQLETLIEEKGYGQKGNPLKGVRVNGCMADSISSVVILPDGRFHSCEHFVDNAIWGSIYTGEKKKSPCYPIDGTNEKTTPLAFWSEKMADLPECETCFCYPQCVRLSHCPNATDRCDPLQQEANLARRQAQMRERYQGSGSRF